MSKAEFVKRADAICAQAVDRQEAAYSEATEAPSEKDNVPAKYTNEELEAIVADAVLPSLARMVDELDDLADPATEGDRAEAVVQQFQSAVDKMETEPAKITAAGFELLDRAQKAAGEFGLEACSGAS